MAKPIPDLPEFDPSKQLTLREACNFGMIPGGRGQRLNVHMVQRWTCRGCRIVPGGELWLFPSIKGPRERFTTPEWCLAWARWVSRLRSEEVRRQLGIVQQCQEIARRKAA